MARADVTLVPPEWARDFEVSLHPMDLGTPLPEGIEQALRDGIERGFEGDRPAFAPDARGYEVRADGLDDPVGVLVVRAAMPFEGAATIEAVAIAPAHRGHAIAMRALLTAEAQLDREGFARRLAVVPQTNGRGLYFMLRCGFAPLQHPPPGATEACTWFERAATLPAESKS